MTKRNFARLSILVLLIAAGCTRKTPMEIETVGLGTVEGVITAWEDLSWNSKNSSVDPAGVTVVLEGTEFSATTDDFGAYKIEAIPAGVYVITAFKDSASAEGYGTVKQYNFGIGGGLSHFSPNIARKTKPPGNVEAVTYIFDGEPGIAVFWEPADPGLSHRYTVWQSPDSSFVKKERAATWEGGGESVGVFVSSQGLPAGETVYFALTAENDVSYINGSTGEEVFPTSSELSEPSDGIVVPAWMPPINRYYSFIEGTVSVWEDLYNLSPSSDHAGVIVALEILDLETGLFAWTYFAETDEDGRYVIEDVPAGTYTVVAFKEGYGTVKEYNFNVLGGISYFSTSIALIADAPVNVQADSTTWEGQSGIRVSWDAPDSGRHLYFVWCTADTSSGEATYLGNTSGSSVSIPYEELPEGALYFGVATDNNIYYVDESTGQTVFPTRSETTWASNTVEIPG